MRGQLRHRWSRQLVRGRCGGRLLACGSGGSRRLRHELGCRLVGRPLCQLCCDARMLLCQQRRVWVPSRPRCR